MLIYRTKTYIVVNTKDKEAFAVYATDEDEAISKVIKSYERDRMPPLVRENVRILEIRRIFDLTEEGKFVTGEKAILYFHNGIPAYKADRTLVKKEPANER